MSLGQGLSKFCWPRSLWIKLNEIMEYTIAWVGTQVLNIKMGQA